jgi:hypothetical protein
MNNNRIYIIFILFLYLLSCQAQNRADGTYSWDMCEFLKISKDSFVLYLYQTYPLFYGLNKNDTILSEGTVDYDDYNVLRLTSKNYERDTEKSMTMIETRDTCIQDSLKFHFIFPFEGHFKLILYLNKENEYSHDNEYEFYDCKSVIVPNQIEGRIKFSFTILNQTPPDYLFRNYKKLGQFRGYPKIKDAVSNSFEIHIPDLTNSYFNRRIISGEYAKIAVRQSKCILLDGEKYSKISFKGQ